MEKELKAKILYLTQNENWVKEALPAMIDKGIHILSSEKAQEAIKEFGRDDVIFDVAFKIIDQYY
ncbi:hypothetical protein D3C75_282200 [compost metagenome]